MRNRNTMMNMRGTCLEQKRMKLCKLDSHMKKRYKICLEEQKTTEMNGNMVTIRNVFD